MKYSLFVLVILMGALSAQAQVRTWAFSKDTVYEWASNRDSVALMNGGTDTLKFDSVSLELVRPAANFFQVGIASFYLTYAQGNVSGTGFRTIVVAPGQTKGLVSFQVEDMIIRTAKTSAIVQGDTLLVRMIFMASASRGRDTLMLKGKQDLPVALRLPGAKLRPLSSDDRLFDLRGRRLESVPQGLKALKVFAPARE